MESKFIIFVGLMGAGKTSLGRRVASALGLPFIDTDSEVEKAAGCTVGEIFRKYGEEVFRKGEQRVIERVLDGEISVVATGGGSFVYDKIRRLIKNKGVSVWLRADLELLYRRTKNRKNRPLLDEGDPKMVLDRLMKEREIHYSKADIIFDVFDEGADDITQRLIGAIREHQIHDHKTE